MGVGLSSLAGGCCGSQSCNYCSSVGTANNSKCGIFWIQNRPEPLGGTTNRETNLQVLYMVSRWFSVGEQWVTFFAADASRKWSVWQFFGRRSAHQHSVKHKKNPTNRRTDWQTEDMFSWRRRIRLFMGVCYLHVCLPEEDLITMKRIVQRN